jgi:putative oxidoreductase
MDVVILIGRILFVLIFVSSGVMGHFGALEGSTQYAKAWGVASARLAVIVSGFIITVGGLMIALGIWMDLGAVLLIVFLVPTAFLMHPFWKVEDQMQKAGEQAQFMKNISLTGAALILLGFVGIVGDDLGLTITGPLFV